MLLLGEPIGLDGALIEGALTGGALTEGVLTEGALAVGLPNERCDIPVEAGAAELFGGGGFACRARVMASGIAKYARLRIEWLRNMG